MNARIALELNNTDLVSKKWLDLNQSPLFTKQLAYQYAHSLKSIIHNLNVTFRLEKWQQHLMHFLTFDQFLNVSKPSISALKTLFKT